MVNRISTHYSPLTTNLTGIKTVYNKNQLKNLTYIQENKPCNEQTIKGLFRAIVEPILEANVEAVVLCRLEEKSVEILTVF